PDETTVLPQQMHVDWVRVYERDADAHAATFHNGGFEEGGGVLAGWSVVGDKIAGNPNIRLASEAVANGKHALKLFGVFDSSRTSYSGVSQGITVQPGATVNASLMACTRAEDSIAGSDNRAVLKIEFYHEFGGKYGSGQMISEQEKVVANGDSRENAWQEQTFSAAVPAGAVEARLSVIFCQPSAAAGSVYIDDVSLASTLPQAAAGDYHGRSTANAAYQPRAATPVAAIK
ncbi:MAG: hypothetical protein AAGF31_12100, partial [Planctomycetota bacterium]